MKPIEESLQSVVAQEIIELRFNRKHVDRKIKTVIEGDSSIQLGVTKGIELVKTYMAGTDYPEDKLDRITQIKDMDPREIVVDLLTGIAYVQRPELFVSVTAQLAARLGLDDKTQAIATTAELVAVLCETDLFDIGKTSDMPGSQLVLVSRMKLPESLCRFITDSMVLPPMVCTPMELTHNYASGYLTHNDSLVLGAGNHHDGDLCLDALNIANSVALRLAPEFLDALEEPDPEWESEPTREDLQLWQEFKEQTKMVSALMIEQGNRFWFCHKVDKRGRMYATGYQLTTQGTAYKKATIELANEELVEGI